MEGDMRIHQQHNTGAIPLNTPGPEVSIGRIQIPLPAVLAVLAFMLGGVVSMTLVWAESTDPAKHLEPALVTAGGGVAYKNEIKTTRQDFKDALVDEHRAMRKMLLQMVLRCRKASPAGVDLDCKVSYLPEPE
jgi:hypothetical protein